MRCNVQKDDTMYVWNYDGKMLMCDDAQRVACVHTCASITQNETNAIKRVIRFVVSIEWRMVRIYIHTHAHNTERDGSLCVC